MPAEHDTAPDPLDRPAAALAAELAAWCGGQEGIGVWLPALPWGQWLPWQRDLARRLAAAVLAAGGRPGPPAETAGTHVLFPPATGVVNDPNAGRAAMTAEDLSGVAVRHLRDAGCVITPGAADDLTPVLAAAIRAAEAAAADRRREADAALLESWAAEAQAAAFGWHALVAHRLRQAALALRAGGGGAGGAE